MTLVLLALGAGLVDRGLRQERASRGDRLATDLADHGHEIERTVEGVRRATHGFATLLRRGGDPAGAAEDFLADEPTLSGLALRGPGEVGSAWPADAASCGASLGASGAPGLHGPFRNGSAVSIAVLEPVDARRAAVGCATIDAILSGARLETLVEAGLDVQLRALDPDGIVHRSTELDLVDPIRVEVALPGSRTWALEAAPSEGWPGWASAWARLLMVLVIACGGGALAYDSLRSPDRLRQEILQRRQDADRAWGRLDEERRRRETAEARSVWKELDRVEQVGLAVLVSGNGAMEAAQLGYAIREVFRRARVGFRDFEVEGGLARLREQGLVTGDLVLQIAAPALARIEEVRRPPEEIARLSLERVGSFRIEERLGGGGMGEVFRASRVEDDTPAAVKLLYPQGSEDEELRARFEREGRIAETLDHPNLVKFLERGEHEGRLYLAMELLEGPSLQDVDAMSPKRALAVVTRLAEALAVLHESGIVHRDVKAANVLLEAGDRPVLLDFGLAVSRETVTLTRSNVFLGTPHYMSPERVRGRKACPGTDVWALGILWWHLVAGQPPWRQAEGLELLEEILNGCPDPRRDLADRIGRAPAEVLARMLDQDPDRRPTGRDLVALLSELPPATPDSRAVDPGRRTLRIEPTQPSPLPDRIDAWRERP